MKARMICGGCGAETPLPQFFKCPAAGSDGDHVLSRVLTDLRPGIPEARAFAPSAASEPNPFLRYRDFLFYTQIARGAALSDVEVTAIARALDDRVAEVDGHGFRATPLIEAARLAKAVGLDATLLVKDETGNVSGSHKARHLMGVALALEMAERAKLPGFTGPRGVLAISSCGNAALGAAVVARAAGRKLRVFVPTWADKVVLERLRRLEAEVVICERDPAVPGDPCTLRLRASVEEGAIPFSCQGPDNGLAVEGGITLGYEIVADLIATGRRLDRVFVQVGGGALASACVQAFRDAKAMGLIERLPVIHAVQAAGAAPLVRAFHRLSDRFPVGSQTVDETIAWAAKHRSELMWPWEGTPASIAHGILDDETYDWLWIVRGMLESGGSPVIAPEETLARANALGREHTGIPVDATGSAGLAGLMEHVARAGVDSGETVAVLFTGHERA